MAHEFEEKHEADIVAHDFKYQKNDFVFNMSLFFIGVPSSSFKYCYYALE